MCVYACVNASLANSRLSVHQACRIMLTVPFPPELETELSNDAKGYGTFYQSLLSLMCCGADYERHGLKLQERVLSACASHQCFSLCMNLLSQLPPSYTVLYAAVDGRGLSCKVCVWGDVFRRVFICVFLPGLGRSLSVGDCTPSVCPTEGATC